MAMRSRNGEIKIEVTVKKTELLERLKESRERHAKEYSLALLAWQAELKKVASEVESKEWTSFPEDLECLIGDCPESHIEDYDQAFDMFSMCVQEEVTLDSDSFNTFCRDQWGWKSYTSSNRFYQRICLS